ncbi:MAG TPA: sulfate ABC transporter permease subunit CysW [Polyangiaceae bacterium]
MSGAVAGRLGKAQKARGPATSDGPLAERILICLALGFLCLFLAAPIGVVFASAFCDGIRAYFEALSDPMTLSAIRLTLLTAAIAVPINLVFGLSAAWLISKYEFRGKGLLVTLIDVPFSVSPVVSGLIFVLLFGRNGWFGPALEMLGVKVIYAVPGIVLATIFVTFPIVAREVLAVMQAQGSDEELAALTLGAGGWQIFRRITLPKIKWGVIYGVILCNARAMGEFGAVSVVSGHIRGETNTMPLHIEILYGEYNTRAAFAVASLLALLAFVTLGLKHWVEWHAARQSTQRERQPVQVPDLTVSPTAP